MTLNLASILIQVILLSTSLVMHELCHYLVAKLLGYQPGFNFEKFLSLTVSYVNKGNALKNSLISASAPVTLFFIGLMIPNKIIVLSLFKFACLLNIFHLMPFCNDGQVIFVSLLSLLKRGIKQ
ncbi:metalloprotease family protein [Streptococcus sobrinus]|uniref:Peptidase, M50 family n=2 Tax=Streptococcus sobrinus TaxID=1310 RepID=U2JG40_9STRE|nr:metalloprotease family protein [Streptococcus sobrinus]AWN21709.1 hypothetical protein DK182_10460 [Streptococcus sobrinus]AWN62489.1 hypothetical protein DLJ52_10135 [Streptococcus sobrinus]AWN64364.1 hypothetical protein DLJ51_10140 [Streptococcus sobrinus]EMP72735.1 hypothetical protein D823_01590 [Streptococcus sobrinus DSM 20742 = ATCC 33478]ERJ79002.1 hypothetical protein HMPREF1557_00101 [Streptococcus sobrinus W1703]